MPPAVHRPALQLKPPLKQLEEPPQRLARRRRQRIAPIRPRYPHYPARLHHPPQLPHRRHRLAQMLRHRHRQRRVESIVRKRQVQDIPHLKAQVGQIRALRQLSRPRNHPRLQIAPDNLPRRRYPRQILRYRPRPATAVQYLHPRLQMLQKEPHRALRPPLRVLVLYHIHIIPVKRPVAVHRHRPAIRLPLPCVRHFHLALLNRRSE